MEKRDQVVPTIGKDLVEVSGRFRTMRNPLDIQWMRPVIQLREEPSANIVLVKIPTPDDPDCGQECIPMSLEAEIVHAIAPSVPTSRNGPVIGRPVDSEPRKTACCTR